MFARKAATGISSTWVTPRSNEVIQPFDRRVESALRRERPYVHLVDDRLASGGACQCPSATRTPCGHTAATSHPRRLAATDCADRDTPLHPRPAKAVVRARVRVPRCEFQHPRASGPDIPYCASPTLTATDFALGAHTLNSCIAPHSSCTHSLTSSATGKSFSNSCSGTAPPLTLAPVSRLLHRPSGRAAVVPCQSPARILVSRGTIVATSPLRR